MPHYSDGERAGVLVKFSQKGVIWRSWEGEVMYGQSSDRWYFSTRDEDMATKLNEKIGQEVTIRYHEYLVGPIQQGTSYTAIDVN